jgi:hypothetical protein
VVGGRSGRDGESSGGGGGIGFGVEVTVWSFVVVEPCIFGGYRGRFGVAAYCQTSGDGGEWAEWQMAARRSRVMEALPELGGIRKR